MILPVLALHAILGLAGLAVKDVIDLVSQRHRPAAAPISSETLEIDIQAPIEVVLEYITSYNYLISDHDEDAIHDLHSWVLQYSPSRIWNSETKYIDYSAQQQQQQQQQQQGRGVIELASPCVVAVTSRPSSVDTIMNDIVKNKKKRHTTKHYRSQKIAFHVCPHWQVNRHADKPNLWTKVEMMISVNKIPKNVDLIMALLHNEFEPKKLPGVILDMILDGKWNQLTILSSAMLKWVKRSSEADVTRTKGEKTEQPSIGSLKDDTTETSNSEMEREKIEALEDVDDTLSDSPTLQDAGNEAENEDETQHSTEIIVEDEAGSSGEELDQQSADTPSEFNGVDTAAEAENLNSGAREVPKRTDRVAEIEKGDSDEKQETQTNLNSPLGASAESNPPKDDLPQKNANDFNNKNDEQFGAEKNTVADGGMPAEGEDAIAKAFKWIHDYVDEANLMTIIHEVRPARLCLIVTACLLLVYNIYLCLGACFMSRQKFVMRKSANDDDLKSLKSIPSSQS